MFMLFDDMITGMLLNRKPNSTITWRKLNISLVFITKCYFAIPKNIRLNSANYFFMKISNKRWFQQIAN